jgi:hypothetical protein
MSGGGVTDVWARGSPERNFTAPSWVSIKKRAAWLKMPEAIGIKMESQPERTMQKVSGTTSRLAHSETPANDPKKRAGSGAAAMKAAAEVMTNETV